MKPIGHVANLIVLITKQMIYRFRCQKEILRFPVLKAQINNIENIEKYIAMKNNKLYKHEKKWMTIKNYNIHEQIGE